MRGFSIVIPTHRDFDGAFFTVAALQLYHPLARDVVVVDSDPAGPHGAATRDYCRGAGARYLPYTGRPGPAGAKDFAVRQARLDHVVCLDSHVLLLPGALEALAAAYADRPDSPDLYHGPLVYDDRRSVSTHFSDVWRGHMWGTWATGWVCRCGRTLAEVEAVDHQALLRDAWTRAPLTGCACGAGGLDGPFVGHETRLKAAGWAPLAEHDRPVPIPAQGMGLFATRRDSWLGFNPAFKGFGGEEWYIHAKYRLTGRTAWCVPGLKWMHRFGRPGGVPYPLRLWDRVRNYAVGLRELGLPLDAVEKHFVGNGVTGEQWRAILAGAEDPAPVAAPAAEAAAAAAVPAAKEQCPPCQARAAAAAAPVPVVPRTPELLEAAYERARATPSDVNEHLATLRRLGTGCAGVAVLGGWHHLTTLALLAGRPGRLEVVDPAGARELVQLGADAAALGVGWRHQLADYLAGDLEPGVDGLFTDSRHTAEQLYQELTRYHEAVGDWVAVHDTAAFGERGEDGGPGLLPGLRRFLKEHPEWLVVEHHEQNNGLTVISKHPRHRRALPSAPRMAWNYAKAVAANALAGAPTSTEEVRALRLDTCGLCSLRVDSRCSKCGCYLDAAPDGRAGKADYADAECPLGYWAQAEALGRPVVPLPVLQTPPGE